MARKAFYGFHYEPDNWRVSKVRNMGVIEGNQLASDNEWEEIVEAGAPAIEKWIKDQQQGKSIVIVLIGANTASRKWVKYEIERGWNDNRAVLGINIHDLEDRNGNQSSKGRNPFEDFEVDGKKFSSVVKAYDPPQTTSGGVYGHISTNLADWIEEAIDIRNSYPTSSALS